MQILITANIDIRAKVDFEKVPYERSIQVKTNPEGETVATLEVLECKSLTGPFMKELCLDKVYNIAVFNSNTNEVYFEQSMKLTKIDEITEENKYKDMLKIYTFMA